MNMTESELKELGLSEQDMVVVTYKSNGKQIAETAFFNHVDKKGRLHAKLTTGYGDWLCVWLSGVEKINKL